MTSFFYNSTCDTATTATVKPKLGAWKTAGRTIPGGGSLPTATTTPAPPPAAPATTQDRQASVYNTMDGQHTNQMAPQVTIGQEVEGTDADSDFEERAAIIEHCGGTPRQWAEGLAQLCCMRPPEDIPLKRWLAVVSAAGIFADKWARQAASLGWSVQEVFGCHSGAPITRVDAMGLLLAMSGAGVQLVELTADLAVFEVGRTRARQNLRRDEVLTHEQRLLWESATG